MLFQLGKILCFKPRVRKVERTGVINAFIERARMWGYKASGKPMFPKMSGDTFNAPVDVTPQYKRVGL